MDRLIGELQETQPTDAAVGVTLTGIRPEGFHQDRYHAVLGRGTGAFERAVTGLKTWKADRAGERASSHTARESGPERQLS